MNGGMNIPRKYETKWVGCTMAAKTLNRGPSAPVWTLILPPASWVTQGKSLNYASLSSSTRARNNTYLKGLLISK